MHATSPSQLTPDWFALLGRSPLDPLLRDLLVALTDGIGVTNAMHPEVKSYRDCVYFNYFDLGLSLQFVPIGGYALAQGLQLEALDLIRLALDTIDIYNVPSSDPANTRAKSKASHYKSYPRLPMLVEFSHKDKSAGPSNSVTVAPEPAAVARENLDKVSAPELTDITEPANPQPVSVSLDAHTTGKDIVARLGEPDRKGGGSGPTAGSIGIWCEWSKLGAMVEFGGDEARGPQAWERGREAIWSSLTLFKSRS